MKMLSVLLICTSIYHIVKFYIGKNLIYHGLSTIISLQLLVVMLILM